MKTRVEITMGLHIKATAPLTRWEIIKLRWELAAAIFKMKLDVETPKPERRAGPRGGGEPVPGDACTCGLCTERRAAGHIILDLDAQRPGGKPAAHNRREVH